MKNPLPKIQHLINHAEVARRINVSGRYAGHLFTGKKNSVKRIKQITAMLEREVAYLKKHVGEKA